MLKDTSPLAKQYPCAIVVVGPEGPCSNARKGRKHRPAEGDERAGISIFLLNQMQLIFKN